MVAEMRDLPISQNKDDVLSKSGFTNWKKAVDNKRDLATYQPEIDGYEVSSVRQGMNFLVVLMIP